jgi:hypothetical protein
MDTQTRGIGYEMPAPKVTIPASDQHASRRLSPNVAALGFVGMLTAMSSAMIYGLLPVFMVRVLGISIASVGIIEGSQSLQPPDAIISGRRATGSDAAALVILGHACAVMKIFPLAGSASAVLTARVIDRLVFAMHRAMHFGDSSQGDPRRAFAALGATVLGCGPAYCDRSHETKRRRFRWCSGSR